MKLNLKKVEEYIESLQDTYNRINQHVLTIGKQAEQIKEALASGEATADEITAEDIPDLEKYIERTKKEIQSFETVYRALETLIDFESGELFSVHPSTYDCWRGDMTISIDSLKSVVAGERKLL